MEILFTGNKPQKKTYSYSVKENNNANIITFILNKEIEGVDLSSLSCFVKVKGSEIDKDVPTVAVVEDKIHVIWTLLRKHTDSRMLLIQLQFEGTSDIVWQTEIITIVLSDTIKADKYIENKYPSVLINHEERISELEESGGGGSGESKDQYEDVKIVEMKILQEKIYIEGFDKVEQNRFDYVLNDLNDHLYLNDPRHAFLYIKTSFISKRMEEEIKNGRFVIRFDYSIPYNKNEEVKQKGQGCYSFARNFYKCGTHKNEPIEYRSVLINSLVYVKKSNIKTTDYGDKYILIKMPLVDLVNKLYFTRTSTDDMLNPFTDTLFDNFNEKYDSGVFDFIDGVRVGGAIQSPIIENVTIRGSGERKYFKTNFHRYNQTADNGKPTPFHSPNKTISILNYWCPFVLDKDKEILTTRLTTRFSRRRKIYYDVIGLTKKYNRFFMGASIKPRCAIIRENLLEKNKSVWLKTYSQYEKRLWARPTQIFRNVDMLTDNYNVVIFRFGISK